MASKQNVGLCQDKIIRLSQVIWSLRVAYVMQGACIALDGFTMGCNLMLILSEAVFRQTSTRSSPQQWQIVARLLHRRKAISNISGCS